jgi:FtsH-binding integral membrane protein
MPDDQRRPASRRGPDSTTRRFKSGLRTIVRWACALLVLALGLAALGFAGVFTLLALADGNFHLLVVAAPVAGLACAFGYGAWWVFRTPFWDEPAAASEHARKPAASEHSARSAQPDTGRFVLVRWLRRLIPWVGNLLFSWYMLPVLLGIVSGLIPSLFGVVLTFKGLVSLLGGNVQGGQQALQNGLTALLIGLQPLGVGWGLYYVLKPEPQPEPPPAPSSTQRGAPGAEEDDAAPSDL